MKKHWKIVTFFCTIVWMFWILGAQVLGAPDGAVVVIAVTSAVFLGLFTQVAMFPRKGRHMVAIIGLLVICFLVYVPGWIQRGYKTTVSTTEDRVKADDIDEIGWRPIVSSKIEIEEASGVSYVLIAISSQTNDVTSYRECFLNEYSAASGRTNPETGVWEVYVVAKEFKYPVPHQQYFAMRYARSLRK